MPKSNLFIVESPAKAKTIRNYLGPDYEVIASFGHIRDLPSKTGSVDPDNDFAMLWELSPEGKKVMKKIKDSLKGVDRLILATDPDREGEAISWHILSSLTGKKNALSDINVERITFSSVTKKAITTALANPRKIDQNLIDAYLARRAIDYLYGFTLSPVLWRKLPGARSAGRVQSVALKIICQRHHEIQQFKSEEYWSLETSMKGDDGAAITANLWKDGQTKLEKMTIGSEAQALEYKTISENSSYRVTSIESKVTTRSPYAPFITSSLQQDASIKLGLSPAQTMRIAQKLYEGVSIGSETTGLITYMRTDGVDVSPEAVTAARNMITAEFGADYLPPKPRVYKSKIKNAQEAHEAIRPTDPRRTPASVKTYLDKDQFRVYDLIWKRAVASQMEAAKFNQTVIEIEATGGERPLVYRATGKVMVFPGFLRLYGDHDDDSTGHHTDRLLPKLDDGQSLNFTACDAKQHHTEPPPKYSEASIIKRLEELGIGRPSTYASTVALLKDREYVKTEKKRLIPEDKGILVSTFLENFFNSYVENDFTADLEEKLDDVSVGGEEWQGLVRDFWTNFSVRANEIINSPTSEILETLNEKLGDWIFDKTDDGEFDRTCSLCGKGNLSVKPGKYGVFIGCSNYPECRYTRPFEKPDPEAENARAQAATPEMIVLGQHPENGEEITVRDGRFGPYFQESAGKGAKRMSVPKHINWLEVTLEDALKYLSLPRLIGTHPTLDADITATIGKYGPYLSCNRTSASLGSIDEVFEVGLNRAVALLDDKKAGKSAKARGGRTLGEHSGGEIVAMSGRYGPYLKFGKNNVKIPDGSNADTISLAEAIPLVDAHMAKSKK